MSRRSCPDPRDRSCRRSILVRYYPPSMQRRRRGQPNELLVARGCRGSTASSEESDAATSITASRRISCRSRTSVASIDKEFAPIRRHGRHVSPDAGSAVNAVAASPAPTTRRRALTARRRSRRFSVPLYALNAAAVPRAAQNGAESVGVSQLFIGSRASSSGCPALDGARRILHDDWREYFDDRHGDSRSDSRAAPSRRAIRGPQVNGRVSAASDRSGGAASSRGPAYRHREGT